MTSIRPFPPDHVQTRSLTTPETSDTAAATPTLSAADRPAPRRRRQPWLLVAVDDSAASYGALVWSLREAARREATVLAVAVVDGSVVGDVPVPLDRIGGTPGAAEQTRDHQVERAVGETGVRGRIRTAVLDPSVLEALTGAANGADLVVVGSHGKTLLRPAVPRLPLRRAAGA
jgi:nucleotide-binding universal stress UspA family protein